MFQFFSLKMAVNDECESHNLLTEDRLSDNRKKTENVTSSVSLNFSMSHFKFIFS